MCVCVSVCSVVSDLLGPSGFSLPVSSMHGIFQARILEWVAVSYSRGSSQPGIEPEPPASSALAGRFFTTVPATWETQGGMQHSQFT